MENAIGYIVLSSYPLPVPPEQFRKKVNLFWRKKMSVNWRFSNRNFTPTRFGSEPKITKQPPYYTVKIFRQNTTWKNFWSKFKRFHSLEVLQNPTPLIFGYVIHENWNPDLWNVIQSEISQWPSKIISSKHNQMNSRKIQVKTIFTG